MHLCLKCQPALVVLVTCTVVVPGPLTPACAAQTGSTAASQSRGDDVVPRRIKMPEALSIHSCLRYLDGKLTGVFYTGLHSELPGIVGQVDEGATKLAPQQTLQDVAVKGRLHFTALSPDGNQLLVLWNHANVPEWVVNGMDGTKLMSRAVPPGATCSQTAWLPDGSGWVQFENTAYDNKLYLYKRASSSRGWDASYSVPSTHFTTLLGCLDKGRIMFYRQTGPYEAGNTCDIRVFDLTTNPPGITSSHTALFDVRNAMVRGASLSTACDGVAWYTHTPGSNTTAANGTQASIWVSDISGNRARKIATINIPKQWTVWDDATFESGDTLPQSLVWSADGRSLLYVYDKSAWVVNVSGNSPNKPVH